MAIFHGEERALWNASFQVISSNSRREEILNFIKTELLF